MGINLFALGYATKLLELGDVVVLGYLDAGTGSLIFQVLVASLVSAGVVFGGVMSQVRGFFSRVVLRRAAKPSISEPGLATGSELAGDQSANGDQQSPIGHEHRKAA